jgi:gluconokinase
MVVILMGVAGSGKTTVGTLLATDLGWPFYEGDDFHPPKNIRKMKRGIPLSDKDRAPWLQALRDVIRRLLAEGRNGVIACSALKGEYRRFLREGQDDVVFVYLKGSYDLISGRLAQRRGHFMGPALLKSQFETLEEPEEAIIIDASPEPRTIVQTIESRLGQTRGKLETQNSRFEPNSNEPNR